MVNEKKGVLKVELEIFLLGEEVRVNQNGQTLCHKQPSALAPVSCPQRLSCCALSGILKGLSGQVSKKLNTPRGDGSDLY